MDMPQLRNILHVHWTFGNMPSATRTVLVVFKSSGADSLGSTALRTKAERVLGEDDLSRDNAINVDRTQGYEDTYAPKQRGFWESWLLPVSQICYGPRRTVPDHAALEQPSSSSADIAISI